MIELPFMKVLILIRQVHLKNPLCVTIGSFLDKGFRFQPTVWSGFHDALMMSININSIAILNIHGVDYRCNVNGISKSEAINLFKNAELSKKSETL